MVVEMHVGGVRGIRAGEQGDEADEARSGTRNLDARCRCVAPRARNRGHRLAAYRQCSADLPLESGRRGCMEYRYGNELDLDQVTDLYRASTLGERRPIDDPAIVRSMLEHANLVVTAWDGSLMVGLARTLTDFSYVGYLSDLAVRESHQR